MKTKNELNALKEEVETLNKKLTELTDEELAEVSGGISPLGRSGIRDITRPVVESTDNDGEATLTN